MTRQHRRTVERARSLLERREAVLLDVRTLAEFRPQHIARGTERDIGAMSNG